VTGLGAVTPVGVVHGRFQVLHNDHVRYILAGKERCDRLVIGITNPDPRASRAEPADPGRGLTGANPLTYYERYQLVAATLCSEGLDQRDCSIVPFPISVPELYAYYVPLDATFFLTIYDDWGRAKLARFKALGLRSEVMWDRPTTEKGLTATAVRLMMATDRPWKDLVPASTIPLLEAWGIPDRLKRMASEGL
jgi:nicotinamide mononucleotide adenylyltransferase